MVRANQKRSHRSIPKLTKSGDQLGQRDQAESVNKQGVRRGRSFGAGRRPVGPLARHGEEAELGMTQAQRLDIGDAPHFQDCESLTVKRVKRMGDLSRSQRPFG